MNDPFRRDSLQAVGVNVGHHVVPHLALAPLRIRVVDVVGVEHVCIGTDQSANPGILPDYSQWVHLVAAMLRGGFTPEEAEKIAGGNYMRIFCAAVG